MSRPRGRAIIDFETRSVAKLRNVGTWRYSVDPTTEVLCMAFRLPHWAPGRTALWTNEFPGLGMFYQGGDWDDLLELWDWIERGGLVEAHGVWFEYCIWNNIMEVRYGWTHISAWQWRCSAAKAAAVALPRGLDAALAAIGLQVRKDATGSKVMMKMTKPRKPRKAEREKWVEKYGEAKPHKVLYFEDRHLLDQLFAYVRQDVLAEEALSSVLPDLSADEQDLFNLDLLINARGYQLDEPAVRSALILLAHEVKKLNDELAEITDGQVLRGTMRAKLLAWLEENGTSLMDTQAPTLDAALAGELDVVLTPETRRALEILRTVGRSSTAKYEKMEAWADPHDWRVRGGLLYHGATTGRWSGQGVQPHNFPKGTLKDPETGKLVKDIEALWLYLKNYTAREIVERFGSVLEPLSHALRGAIIARPGSELFVADYAAIEARVVMWLAGDEKALNIFRKGEDIYCDMASSVYGFTVTKDNPVERGMGKIAILGLGYQMGWMKFKDTCAKFGVEIEDEFAQQVVTAYRKKYWRVKQLWEDQEKAAIQATRYRTRVKSGYITWLVEGKFLFAELPSGRRLAYPFPSVKKVQTSWGETKEALTFYSVDAYTHQWKRQTTYGGMIVENLTQAVARDLLANAMKLCEATECYMPILSVHDEIVAEAVLGYGNIDEFTKIMKTVPDWAPGCPVDAEAWHGPRYKKG